MSNGIKYSHAHNIDKNLNIKETIKKSYKYSS